MYTHRGTELPQTIYFCGVRMNSGFYDYLQAYLELIQMN